MTVCLFRIACWTPSYQVTYTVVRYMLLESVWLFVRSLDQGIMYTSESQMVITMQLMSLKSEPHTIHHKGTAIFVTSHADDT